MRPLRLLLLGPIVIIRFLSKHDGISDVRFNAQHGELVGRISGYWGFSEAPLSVQQGELVGN